MGSIAIAWTLSCLLEQVPKEPEPLKFVIVETEVQPKGASVNPVRPNIYKLFVAKVALDEPEDKAFTKEAVEVTLRKALDTIREGAKKSGESIDGITAQLFLSKKHIKGDSGAFACGEWWPKGHSFSKSNDANVKDKSTYVEEITVFSMPTRERVQTLDRLPLEKRKAIFADLVKAEDRARSEAQKKYPSDETKQDKEYLLRKKAYVSPVLRRHKITAKESDLIMSEARVKDWPFPKLEK